MPRPLLSSWDSRVQSWITDWRLHFLLWLRQCFQIEMCFKIDWFFCRIVLLVPFPFLLNERFLISVESEFYFDWNGTTAIRIQNICVKPQATEIPDKPSTWLMNTPWGDQMILYFHFCNTVSGFDLAIKEVRWKSKKMPVSALCLWQATSGICIWSAVIFRTDLWIESHWFCLRSKEGKEV